MIIEHMREGNSLLSFAVEIGIDVDVLSDWAKAHPDFHRAKRRGEQSACRYWERHAQGISKRASGNVNNAMTIFLMKCRFGRYGYLPDESMAGEGEGFEFEN